LQGKAPRARQRVDAKAPESKGGLPPLGARPFPFLRIAVRA